MAMNEFDELVMTKLEIFHLKLDNTKAMRDRGLKFYLGDKARWIKEYDEVAEWLGDNHNKGLLLYGKNGRGKSLLCYDIIPVLITFYNRGIQSYRCRANDLWKVMPEKEDYYQMVRSKCIYIDDFGTEDIKNNFGEKRDVFSDIVDLAEKEKKLLVLSTNLMPKEISIRYGVRTLDRLRALTHPICFEGESMRG